METYKGYRLNIGGYRLFAKVSEVEALWHELMGGEMPEVDRLLRIHYDGNLFHTVIRQRKTYPVYDATYKQHLSVMRDYLKCFQNLQTVGGAGMHRHNNQDHSMPTVLLVVRNVAGEEHDVWNVNVECSCCYEDFTVEERERKKEELERQQKEPVLA